MLIVFLTGWYIPTALPDAAPKQQMPTRSPGADGSDSGFLPFPQPVYQAGELSQYEGTVDHGFSERESEEQGSPPLPPPFPVFAPPETAVASVPGPLPPYWGLPYYYDFNFLMGQYPPGTYTYASTTSDHGRDGWRDVHYLKENLPLPAEPVQPSVSVSSAASQSRKASVKGQ